MTEAVPEGNVIVVRYSCTLCGLMDAECRVTERGDEGVLEWTEAMIVELCRDHAARSPGCHPKELHNIKIPIDGADKIGGAPIH